MDIRILLPPHRVNVEMAICNRRAILAKLTAPLLQDGVITDLELFLNDVERREDEMTTQITEDIAIPHARSNAVKRMGLSLGICPAPGVNFCPSLQRPCRIFFLVAVPAFAPTAHLKLLQHLAHFARDAKRLPKLRAVKTAAQAVNLLASFKAPGS